MPAGPYGLFAFSIRTSSTLIDIAPRVTDASRDTQTAMFLMTKYRLDIGFMFLSCISSIIFLLVSDIVLIDVYPWALPLDFFDKRLFGAANQRRYSADWFSQNI